MEDNLQTDQMLGIFHKLVEDLDLTADEISKLTHHFEHKPNQLIDLASIQMCRSLDQGKDELINEQNGLLTAFRERLYKTWATPLDRLDSLLYMCMEVVLELRGNEASLAYEPTDKFNIATRLQARCVQIGNEISHLLHGGFADGAFARWRTLHETAATTKFICEGDEDLSSRFIDYQHKTISEAAERYNKFNLLGFEAFSEEVLAELRAKKQQVLSTHGPKFNEKFGWARKELGDKVKPNESLAFSDIEKFVGLDLLRNHFAFANQYVHAGIDSIGFKLGTAISKRDLLLTGPSNEGLVEPIQCTSLSLIYATEALIKAYPNDESPIRVAVLWLWHEMLKDEAVNADAALRARGEAMSNTKQS